MKTTLFKIILIAFIGGIAVSMLEKLGVEMPVIFYILGQVFGVVIGELDK